MQLLKDLGFGGRDIEWEYQNSTQDAADLLVHTCRLFREERDSYGRNLTGHPDFLTLAVPTGPDNFQYFDMPGLLSYVDFVNYMGYDYATWFSNYSGYMSNLDKIKNNPPSTEFDHTKMAVINHLNYQGRS